MTESGLKELAERAKGLAPGHLEASKETERPKAPPWLVMHYNVGNVPVAWCYDEAYARFIAAANPEAVLRLLAENEALRKAAFAAYHALTADRQDPWEMLRDAEDALEAILFGPAVTKTLSQPLSSEPS